MKPPILSFLSTRNQCLELESNFLFLHQVSTGSARVQINNVQIHLVPETYLVTNPNSQHTLIAQSHPIYTAAIHASLLNNERFEECSTPRDFHVDLAISNLVSAVSQKVDHDPSDLAANLLKSLIDAKASKQPYFLSPKDNSKKEQTRLMNLAREFVLTNLHLPISVSDVAKHVGFSEYYFHRRFTAWHQIRPGQYILGEKIRKGCRQLVLEDEPVWKISQECGFLSPTSFARAFQMITGNRPSAFRERHKHLRQSLEWKLSNPAL
jgi:AraC-like DNA-binding protein